MRPGRKQFWKVADRSLDLTVSHTEDTRLFPSIQHHVFTILSIQEAALKLIPDSSLRAAAHLRIGRKLVQPFEAHTQQFEGMDNSLLFLSCDQLNLGKSLVVDEEERWKLVKLNLLAAKRAASFSAFVPSMTYLKTAVEMIPKRNTCWSEDYSLMLELFTLLAEMSFFAGQTDTCNDAVDEVIKNAKCIEDSFTVYIVKVQGLAAAYGSNPSGLLSGGLSLLKKLGEKFSRKPGP